jgi:hypothetical protein
MLTSCPCDGGLSKNVIGQSDRSTCAACDVARPVKNDPRTHWNDRDNNANDCDFGIFADRPRLTSQKCAMTCVELSMHFVARKSSRLR